MDAELFGQLTTALGGPGAVIFLWWYMSRPAASDRKEDPAKAAAEDIRAIKEILHEIYADVQVLLDRTSRK